MVTPTRRQIQTQSTPSSSSTALVTQQDGVYDWSAHATEALFKNTTLMANISDVPPEVFTDLCSPSCLKRLIKYRHHNQTLIDDFNNISRANDVLIENEQIWKDKVKSLNETISELQSDIGDKRTQLNDVLTCLTSTKKELADAQEKLLKSETKLVKLHDASKLFDVSTEKNMGKGLGYKAVPPPADYARMPDFTKTVFVKPTVSSLDPETSSGAPTNSTVCVSDSGVTVEKQDTETALKARIGSSSNTSTSSCNDNANLFDNVNFFDELDILMKTKFDKLDKEHNVDSKFVSTNDNHNNCDFSNTKPLKDKGKNVIVIPENEASSSYTANLKPSVPTCSTDTSKRKDKPNNTRLFKRIKRRVKTLRHTLTVNQTCHI